MQNNSQGGHFVQARGPGADSEEKREPVSDIDTAVADSLKVLDLKRPIREADISGGPSWAKERTRSRGKGWRRGRAITSAAVTI